MTLERKTRFRVISNEKFEEQTDFKEKHKSTISYQTNPMTEKLMKFINNEGGRRFTVEDLLR